MGIAHRAIVLWLRFRYPGLVTVPAANFYFRNFVYVIWLVNQYLLLEALGMFFSEEVDWVILRAVLFAC